METLYLYKKILPRLSWICSTLTEFRNYTCGIVCSICSLSGITLFVRTVRPQIRWTLTKVGSHPNLKKLYTNTMETLHLYKKNTPQVGLEPTTYRLTAGCSTIELLRNICKFIIPKTFFIVKSFL